MHDRNFVTMDDSPDTSSVLLAVPVAPQPSSVPASKDFDKASSQTAVVFIPPENGKLGGNPPAPLSMSPSSARILQAIDGAVISFRDLCYEVPRTGAAACRRCRKEPKRILNNVRYRAVC